MKWLFSLPSHTPLNLRTLGNMSAARSKTLNGPSNWEPSLKTMTNSMMAFAREAHQKKNNNMRKFAQLRSRRAGFAYLPSVSAIAYRCISGAEKAMNSMQHPRRLISQNIEAHGSVLNVVELAARQNR